MYAQADQAHDFPVGPYGVVPGQNANPGVDLDPAILLFFFPFFLVMSTDLRRYSSELSLVPGVRVQLVVTGSFYFFPFCFNAFVFTSLSVVVMSGTQFLVISSNCS